MGYEFGGMIGIGFEAFAFILLSSLASGDVSGCRICHALFKQVVHVVSFNLEKQFTRRNLQTIRGVKRDRSDPDNVTECAFPHTHTVNVLDPNNWRHTERELGRYVAAHVEASRTCPHLALAGPDGTKVGTDLSLLMAAAMNPATGVTGVRIPQVNVLPFNAGFL